MTKINNNADISELYDITDRTMCSRVHALTVPLMGKLSQYTGMDRGFGTGTKGTGHSVGESDHNSQLTTTQLAVALTMSTSGLIDIMAQDRNFPVEQLIEEQVLEGFRILDLGCGEYAVFARIATAMGAEVYTTDYFKGLADALAPGVDDEVQKVGERYCHVDLGTPSAFERLQTRTGGNLDLVTSAFVDEGAVLELEKISWRGNKVARLFARGAHPLLKQKGIFYDGLYSSDLGHTFCAYHVKK